MNRRLFLRNAAILAAGVVAADQLALLDRLEPRRLFPAWGNTNIPPKLWGDGIHDDTRALQWRIDEAFRTESNVVAFPQGTFKVSSAIVAPLRDGMRLDGTGSRLLGAHGGPMLSIPTTNFTRRTVLSNFYMKNTAPPGLSYGAAVVFR